MNCRATYWIIGGILMVTAYAGCAGNVFAVDFSRISELAATPAALNAETVGAFVGDWVRRLFDVNGGDVSVDQSEAVNLNEEITESTGVNLIKFFQFIGNLLLQILSWISWAIQWLLNWLQSISNS